MIENITPLILTYNEAPNIERTLQQLCWARDIVVVDSFSGDETVEIASSFPHVRVVQRAFDNHGVQWAFALNETEISTEWVLALDADYVLPPKFVDELTSLQPATDTNGYQAQFIYCVNGRSLRSGLLPLLTVLYRRNFARYEQDGHAQRLIVEGKVETLRSPILHDDRKPLSRWFQSQQRYMALEAKKIGSAEARTLGIADRVRRLRVIAPLAVLFYCLIVRGGVLDGWAGFYYAFQRMLAELLLSLYLIEQDLSEKCGLWIADFGLQGSYGKTLNARAIEFMENGQEVGGGQLGPAGHPSDEQIVVNSTTGTDNVEGLLPLT